MERRLPASVQQIADVIGRDQALRLVSMLPRKVRRDRGCGEPILYVPRRLPVDHKLVSMIGYADAAKLSRVFGGEILYPASCAGVEKADRREAIAAAVAAGKPKAAVAGDYGVTVQHVRRVARANICPEETARQDPHHSPQRMTAAA